MNKNFAEWYRVASIQPMSEQLENRWNGIVDFIENAIKKDDIFELVRMFNERSTQEEFRDRYVECFIEYDKAFDRNNELELSVLAGATLVEIIENCNYKMLAILATISFSFLENSPVVLSIVKEIKEIFIKETCSIREKTLLEDDTIRKYTQFNELNKALNAQASWSEEIRTGLIKYINETNEALKSLYRQINNIYAEDSQILWWLTGEWSNDLEKPFSELKQADAILFIGKELADKIKTLPGPYSAKAVIHKMLDCCNKKNKCQTITLKDVVENLDVIWREEYLKKYDVNAPKEITPIMFAISKSLTVDEGEEWNPQFRKISKFGADEIKKPVEEMAFQMYLECLTIKCYNSIEE